jgi:hypothetical protein
MFNPVTKPGTTVSGITQGFPLPKVVNPFLLVILQSTSELADKKLLSS